MDVITIWSDLLAPVDMHLLHVYIISILNDLLVMLFISEARQLETKDGLLPDPTRADAAHRTNPVLQGMLEPLSAGSKRPRDPG
jgi:hypothetical protein